jgi:hypothetical protein
MRIRYRRIISLVAAYAIALQAILPLAVAAAYSADPAICSSASEPARHPAVPQHSGDECCVLACGLSCGANALPGSPAIDADIFPARAGTALLLQATTRVASAYQQTPQSRAPPAS